MLVGYNKDIGDTKLIDEPNLNSVDRVKDNLKNRFVKGENLYITPQTFNALATGNKNYEIDPVKEDWFALGLTLLELGNLKPVQDIYDKSSKNVDRGLLQAHIDEFNHFYGVVNPDLVQTVVKATSLDEANRELKHEVTNTFINGSHMHTIVKTRVEALPMDGISLFDNIPEFKKEEFPIEKKVQGSNRSVSPKPEKRSNSNQKFNYEDSRKRIVNADEVINNAPTQVNYQNDPIRNKLVYSIAPVVNRNSSYVVQSVPTQNTVVYVKNPGTSEDISGLKLVRTYVDPTLANQSKNY